MVKDRNFVVEQNNPRELAEKILLALGDDECTITSTFSAYNPQQYPERIPNISIV